MTDRTAWASAVGAAALVLTTATGAHAEGRGDIRVVKTVVNGGANVIVGTSKTIRYPVDITVKDNSGVKGLSHVSTYNAGSAAGSGFVDWEGTSCTKKSSTTSVCRATMSVTPAWIPGYSDSDANKTAGVWQINATVQANDGDYWISDRIALYKVKRAAQLTTVIAPTKVAKGATATVTGKLSRANWEDLKYHGFTGQQVKLQFRKKGTAHYSTVKTVTTGDAGKVNTRVTVTAAGSWRWYFPGTTTTSLKVSAGDVLDLT
ncbi:hypothetical protein [Streptomyces arenae]|uniref:hypothetical protein n=1 Tax=Streptomyces arenae TaxID=29301 RepID=UPI0026580ABB|nr:hypothetical protein [Streptomyces arenae]MCG7205685.1 hypothetical protein [Streptomyces arenae]